MQENSPYLSPAWQQNKSYCLNSKNTKWRTTLPVFSFYCYIHTHSRFCLQDTQYMIKISVSFMNGIHTAHPLNTMFYNRRGSTISVMYSEVKLRGKDK